MATHVVVEVLVIAVFGVALVIAVFGVAVVGLVALVVFELVVEVVATVLLLFVIVAIYVAPGHVGLALVASVVSDNVVVVLVVFVC